MAPLRGGSSGGALAPTTASTPHLTRGVVLHAVNETTLLDALPASLPPSWMYDKLCTDTTCGAEVPGTHTIAFVDQNHLSTAGSLYLGPFLNCFLHDSGLLSA